MLISMLLDIKISNVKQEISSAEVVMQFLNFEILNSLFDIHYSASMQGGEGILITA